MARAHLRFTVKDRAGNVVQNALVNVYQTGTTTAVTDLFAAASGGSPITTLTSNAQGEVEGYLTTAKTIDLNVTDNTDQAYYPSQPSNLLSFTTFTETVEAYNDADDVQTAVSHVSDTSAHVTDAELAAHEADTTSIHGITDTSALETTSGSQAKVDTHAGAGDPHTGYRLESVDHTHQSTGLQAGKIDHGAALDGLGDDDHPQYLLKAFVDAKGDIITASAADTPARLAVGTDHLDYLVSNSGESTGLKWGRARSALRPTAALYETVPRNSEMANASPLNSQTVELCAIDLPTGLLVTSITFVSGSVALGSPGANANQVFGLYNSSRALLRSTTDDTTTAWAANTAKTLTLTSTFTTTYSGLHYLAILVDADGGTVPSLICAVGSTAVGGIAPIITGRSTTGASALPDPAAAITANANLPYAYVS